MSPKQLKTLAFVLFTFVLFSCGDRTIDTPKPPPGITEPENLSCFPLDTYEGKKEFDPAYGLVPLSPDHTHFSHGSLPDDLIDAFVEMMWPPYEYGFNNGSASVSVGSNNDVARAAIFQSDYKLIVVGRAWDGTYNDFGLSKFQVEGALDTTFSNDGVTTTRYWTESWQWAHSVAQDATGKIIAAGRFYHGPSRWDMEMENGPKGQSYNFMIARYSTDGALDATFGDGGVVIQDISTTNLDSTAEFARGVAIQNADNKIIAVGYTGKPSIYDHALMRFNTDGTLDPTFSGDGIVVTDVSPTSENDMALAVALQSDDKIIVTGCSFSGTDCDVSIARYGTDGSLDNTFGTSGITRTDIAGNNDRAFAIVLDPTEKPIVTGRTQSGDWDLLTARYTTAGALDATFGSGGTRVDDVSGGGTNESSRGIVLDRDNKIFLGGRSGTGAPQSFLVMKYLTDGARDTTFNTNGFRTTQLNTTSWANGIAHLNDHLVAVGRTHTGSATHDQFAILRYNSDGTLAFQSAIDNHFGGGAVSNDFAGDVDEAYAVSIDSDGKVYVAGFREDGDEGTRDFAVARYLTNGVLDAQFGAGGEANFDFSADADEALGMALTTDRKIVIVGYRSTDFSNDQNRNFAVMRLLTDGTADNTFSGDGQADFDFSADNDTAYGVVVQGDNKIVVGGYYNTGNGNNTRNFAVIRLLTDGTLDNTWAGDGTALHDSGTSDRDEIRDITITEDNKIYAAGWSEVNGNNGTRRWAILRFDTDGSLDNTWDGDGIMLYDFTADRDHIQSITLQTDGKVVAVGFYNTVRNDNSTRDAAAARFNTDGTIDATFGVAGEVSYPNLGVQDQAECVGIMANGKIVVGGRINTDDAVALRLLTDGNLDTSFGTDGVHNYNLGGTDRFNGCALLPDGRGYFVGRNDDDFAIARIWP